MLGIDNLKKIVKFACDFTKQISSSLSDGWQWTDAFAFVDEMAQVPGVAKSLNQAAAEIADLTSVERDELLAYLEAEFDIPNDKVEDFVEDAIAFSISAISLVEKFRLMKNPPTVAP
jgi:hypothetical protein